MILPFNISNAVAVLGSPMYPVQEYGLDVFRHFAQEGIGNDFWY